MPLCSSYPLQRLSVYSWSSLIQHWEVLIREAIDIFDGSSYILFSLFQPSINYAVSYQNKINILVAKLVTKSWRKQNGCRLWKKSQRSSTMSWSKTNDHAFFSNKDAWSLIAWREQWKKPCILIRATMTALPNFKQDPPLQKLNSEPSVSLIRFWRYSMNSDNWFLDQLHPSYQRDQSIVRKPFFISCLGKGIMCQRIVVASCWWTHWIDTWTMSMEWKRWSSHGFHEAFTHPDSDEPR